MFENALLQLTDSLVGSLIGGSVAAAVVTGIFTVITKRREESAAINNARIAKFNADLVLYLQIRRYYAAIARHIEKNLTGGIAHASQQDRDLLMYFVFKALYAYRQLRIKSGAIMLSDIDIEDIVIKSAEYLSDSLDDPPLGRTSWFKITDILDVNPLFTGFIAAMTQPANLPLYTSFGAWCNGRTMKQIEELKQNCEVVSQIIIFDINLIYKSWYKAHVNWRGDHEFKIPLSDHVISELKKEAVGYYDMVKDHIKKKT
jgi:hypothetical protein